LSIVVMPAATRCLCIIKFVTASNKSHGRLAIEHCIVYALAALSIPCSSPPGILQCLASKVRIQ